MSERDKKLNKLLDFEELHDQKPKKVNFKSCVSINGSNSFVDFYQHLRTISYILIFQVPNSAEITLVNDQTNQVEMSTFMENGDILIKIGTRFL